MTFESDELALKNALARGELIPSSGDFVRRDAYHVFFVYMRINRNGAFIAERFFYKGAMGAPISNTTDPAVPQSLGWFTKEMALNARKLPANRDPQYSKLGDGLSNFRFPNFYSYVVLFMDDLHWPFLETPSGDPVVVFHRSKEGVAYDLHPYAFTPPVKYNIVMPRADGTTDGRHAVAMINRMHGRDDQELGPGVTERFCFDLTMRVLCEGATDRLTIIIDPTGENNGPPDQP